MTQPPPSFEHAIELIIAQNPQFPADAYDFIRRALVETSTHLQAQSNHSRHLSAEELYFGACMVAIREFGPLANEVLYHWNIKSSSDIGTIVYLLINAGIFGKQKEDSQEQFDELPDLMTLLSRPFDANPLDELIS